MPMIHISTDFGTADRVNMRVQDLHCPYILIRAEDFHT